MMFFGSTTHDMLHGLASEKSRLMRHIRKHISDSAEAEDVYQEAMLRAARRLNEGGKLVNPIGYLYQITTNLLNDHYRRQQRANTFGPLTEDILCERPQPDQHLESEQRLKLFVQQLNKLPQSTRTIVIMRKLHGKSYAEIADELGMNPLAVEKRLRRALRAIEAALTGVSP